MFRITKHVEFCQHSTSGWFFCFKKEYIADSCILAKSLPQNLSSCFDKLLYSACYTFKSNLLFKHNAEVYTLLNYCLYSSSQILNS